jgi:membrane protein
MTSATADTSQIGLWTAVKTAGRNWLAHKDSKSGAALAYYSIFSIGPLIVVAIGVAGLVFGREALQVEVTSSVKGILGENGGKAIEAMLASADKHAEGILATVIGTATLIYAAVSVVVQLKDAFNTV